MKSKLQRLYENGEIAVTFTKKELVKLLEIQAKARREKKKDLRTLKLFRAVTDANLYFGGTNVLQDPAQYRY